MSIEFKPDDPKYPGINHIVDNGFFTKVQIFVNQLPRGFPTTNYQMIRYPKEWAIITGVRAHLYEIVCEDKKNKEPLNHEHFPSGGLSVIVTHEQKDWSGKMIPGQVQVPKP